MDLKRRDEEENAERKKDKKILEKRKENDIPKVRSRVKVALGLLIMKWPNLCLNWCLNWYSNVSFV